MNKTFIALMALQACFSALVMADDSPKASAGVGQQTQAALELQRSGREASATERPMSGEVAERTNRRYVDSFSQPIPESFQDEEQEFVKSSK